MNRQPHNIATISCDLLKKFSLMNPPEQQNPQPPVSKNAPTGCFYSKIEKKKKKFTCD